MKAPLYYKIYSSLRRDIETQKLKAGDLLPSETELGKAFNASLAPVRQALSMLQNEGLILRQPGKGAFVAPFSEEMELWLNFSPFQRYFRKHWNDALSKIIEVGERVPPDSIRSFFAAQTQQKVIYIERVRIIEDKPVIANQYYINQQFDIREYVYSDEFFSPRSLIMRKFSIEVTRIEDILTAVSATEHLSRVLALSEGDPLLAVRRCFFADDLLVMADIFHTVTSIWDYRVTFEKSSGGRVVASAGK